MRLNFHGFIKDSIKSKSYKAYPFNLMALFQRFPVLPELGIASRTLQLEPHALHLTQTLTGTNTFPRELYTHLLRLLDESGPQQIFCTFAVYITVSGVQLLRLNHQFSCLGNLIGMLKMEIN